MNRNGWKIALERMPVLSIIEREKYSYLCSRIEQSFAFRVLANCANIRPGRDSVYFRRPGLARIAGLVDVWFVVVEFVTIDRNVGCGGIVWRSFDNADHAPFRKLFW